MKYLLNTKKMKNQFFILLLLTVFAFVGCEKDTETVLDKEISILLLPGAGISSEPWIFAASQPYFNISNYSEINSAVLLVSEVQTWSNTGDIIGEASFELYDMTNDKIIENSKITTDNIDDTTYASSSNFLQNIPKGKIKLGIRISSSEIFSVNGRNFTLVLRR